MREAGRRLAVVVGAFESVHSGTLSLLKDARQGADVVLVGLLTDGANVDDRVRLLLALRDVDFVHVSRTAEDLKALAPHVFLQEPRVGAGDMSRD
jgi:phosphopantetheine adenylyltransferase